MLKQSLTYQLASLAEDAIGPGERLFRQRFHLDVHELRVLRLIDDKPGVRFTQLAQMTKFERSATSRILSRLIKAGLVRRRINEDDARQFELFTTAKTKALRAEAAPLSLAFEELMLKPLTPEEQKNFRATLNKISGWLNEGYLAELAKTFPDTATSAAKTKLPRKAEAAPVTKRRVQKNVAP